MTKTEKLQHLQSAVEWLDQVKSANPNPIERCLYNAIRRIGAVTEELVKDSPPLDQ